MSSRRRLGLAGEREHLVAPLETSSDAKREAESSPAALLFCDRAQMARADFVSDEKNAETIETLVQRLDGLPLAIELAAARSGVLGVAEIIAHLDARQEILASPHADTPPRHRTLRAAIETSFHLLPRQLQSFWTRLAVFRGGWTLEAAQAVCPGKRVLEALSSLRDQSLVVAQERGGAMRFSLLETLREFALEQLSLSEKQDAHRAHAAYFAAWLESFAPALQGAEQAAAFDAIANEAANWRAALDWSEEDDAALDLRLCCALGRFWRTRGSYAEGRERLARALRHDLNQSDATRVLAARASLLLGQLSYQDGDYPDARARLEAAVQAFREIGDARGALHAVGLLGWIAVQTNDLEVGRALLDEALEGYRDNPDVEGHADLLFFCAVAANWRDEDVRLRVENELPLFRARGDGQSVVVALNTLGTHAFFNGQMQPARRFIEESLELAERLGQVWDITLSLWILGNVARSDGDLEKARTHYAASLRAIRQAGKWPAPLLLQSFAYLAFDLKQWPRATLLLSASIALWPREMRAAPAIVHQQESCREKLRAALGETDFQTSWQNGQSTSFEEAVAVALES